MQIKRFEAQNMSDALRLIKQEFGSEAVVLSARSLKKHSGVFGFIQKRGVEVTAATDSLYPQIKKKDSERKTWKVQGGQADVSNLQEVSKKRRLLNSIEGEVRALKNRLSPLGKRKHNQEKNGKGLFALYQQLLAEGVNEDIAMELVEKVDRITLSRNSLKNEEIKSYLTRILKERGMGTNASKQEDEKKKIVALVGPTGVGKTTTVAKLAAVQTFRMGKRVALITLDNDRIGAVEQLRRYAKIMGISLEVASNYQELRKSVKKLKKKELILIDTAGISQRDEHKIRQLKSLLAGISSIEVHLVLSATTKEKDLIDILDTFTIIPIRGLLFTKLDESTTYGALLNQLLRVKVPLSYFTTGQQIPEDIEIATAEKLVDLLIDGRTEKRIGSWTTKSLSGTDGEQGTDNLQSDEFYVANKNSDVFHYPHCKWVRRIKKENMVVCKSRSEVEDKDLRPCRLCGPKEIVKSSSAPMRVNPVTSRSY